MATLDLAFDHKLDHRQRFVEFQRAHPPRTRIIAGVEWSYIAAGHGDDIIVLLPGALGFADTAFRYVLAFASHYRVLSLEYPSAIKGAEPLVNGIAALLASEVSGAVHLVGGSYSGPVAHAFAQCYPTAVRSLLFSNTGIPQRRRIAYLRAIIATVSLLPPVLLQWAMRQSLRWWLPNASAPDASVPNASSIEAFWHDYFAARLPQFNRQFLVNRAHVLLELCDKLPPHAARNQPATHAPLQGPVLIVDACRDRFFTAAERARLRTLYPTAKQVTINASGHGSALKAWAEHVVVYARFWEGV